MSQVAWDPHELNRLRQRLEQLQQELRNVDGRLGQLEQIAIPRFTEEKTGPIVDVPVEERSQSTPPPIPGVPRSSGPIPFDFPTSSPPPLTGVMPTLSAMGEIEDLNLAPEEPRSAGLHSSIPHTQTASAKPEKAAHFPTSRRKKSSAPIDWEAVIGGRWMTWAGAFTLLLAVGFGVHWAWTTLQTPPWVHVLTIHLIGIGFLAAAHFLQRRGVPLAVQALVGLGVFTLYAAAFAALHLYHLWNEQTAFIECAAITVLAIGLAVRANSPAVVLLGALGGFLTPILTAQHSGNYVGLFSYLAFLNVALVTCAVWRGWSFLKPLALAATAIMFFGWWLNEQFDPANSSMVWGTEWFAALHAGIFLIGSTLPPLVWKRVSRSADLLALAAGSLFFIGITWILFRDRPDQQLALVSWGLSALHAALFGLTFAKLTNADRMPRVHLALAVVFFTLAIPLQINDDAYWSATWCLEGCVFTAVGVYFADRQMCVTAAIVLLLAAARLLGWDWQSAPRTIGQSNIDLRFVLLLAGGLMTMFSGGLYRLIPWLFSRHTVNSEQAATKIGNYKLFATIELQFQQISGLLSAVGAVLVTMSPMLQLHDFTYLAPSWAAEALLFTLVGLAVRDWQLRVTALVIFALAAGRLLGFDFTADARPWGQTGIDIRCAAFSLVGLLALVCGAVYRIIYRKAHTAHSKTLDFSSGASILLLALGALLITSAAPLDLRDWSLLSPIWAIEALLFMVVATIFYDLLLAVIGIMIFLSAAVRLGGWDFMGQPHMIAGTTWDVRFVAMELTGLLAIMAGGIYWLIPRWFGRAKLERI